jgi:DNA-binding YbaB/EbfC family protein
MNPQQMQQLMKQAQKMQEQLEQQKETAIFEATAGGGMVSVKMNGKMKLLSLQVDPEVFSAGDKDMLQDLIIAAVNECGRKVDEANSSSVSNMMGGMKIPGMF